MGLVDRQLLSGPGLPVSNKSLIDLLIKLSRNVIGDVEDFIRLLSLNRRSTKTKRNCRV